ncbi:MAG: hypothetical protein JWM11_2702 [Planctomycetaceae bacterium]|nr:hypothetical protein [Planctomycetaceae bacterium]
MRIQSELSHWSRAILSCRARGVTSFFNDVNSNFAGRSLRVVMLGGIVSEETACEIRQSLLARGCRYGPRHPVPNPNQRALLEPPGFSNREFISRARTGSA